MENLIHRSIFLPFFVLVLTQTGLAQMDVVKDSFIHPSVMEFGEYKHAVSLTLATLPEDAIEETSSWVYAPLFSYNAKFGLPLSFNLKSNLSTNIITWQLRSGLQWGYDFGAITLSVNSDVAYWRGRLNNFGFNSGIDAWSWFSNLNIGIAFEKFTLTIEWETDYILSVKQTADDIETVRENNMFAGSSFSIYIEQPVWKENYMYLGMRFHETRYYWPAWAVFPSWNRFSYIPEVVVGFVL